MKRVTVMDATFEVPDGATGWVIKRHAMANGVTLKPWWELQGVNANGSNFVIGDFDVPWQDVFQVFEKPRPTSGRPAHWHGLPRGHMDMLGVCDSLGNLVAHIVERSDEHYNWRLVSVSPDLLAFAQAVLRGIEDGLITVKPEGGGVLRLALRREIDAVAVALPEQYGEGQ